MTARGQPPAIPAVAAILARRPHAAVRWGMAGVALVSLAGLLLLARVELPTRIHAPVQAQGTSAGPSRELSFLPALDAAQARRIEPGQRVTVTWEPGAVPATGRVESLLDASDAGLRGLRVRWDPARAPSDDATPEPGRRGELTVELGGTPLLDLVIPPVLRGAPGADL